MTIPFEQIYRNNIGLVRVIIASFRITNGQADDLAQQTFLQVFEKLPKLRDPTLLRPWIGSIARNYCLSSFRSKKFVAIDKTGDDRSNALNEYQLGLWFDPESGEADIELEQNLLFLHRLLAEYSKEPRGKAARLYYMEGKNTREIAEALQISQNTVLSHLLLFRREMKAALILMNSRAEKGHRKESGRI